MTGLRGALTTLVAGVALSAVGIALPIAFGHGRAATEDSAVTVTTELSDEEFLEAVGCWDFGGDGGISYVQLQDGKAVAVEPDDEGSGTSRSSACATADEVRDYMTSIVTGSVSAWASAVGSPVVPSVTYEIRDADDAMVFGEPSELGLPPVSLLSVGIGWTWRVNLSHLPFLIGLLLTATGLLSLAVRHDRTAPTRRPDRS